MKDSLEQTLIVSAMILAGTLAASAQGAPRRPPSQQVEPPPREQNAPQSEAEAPPGSADLSHSQGVLTPPPTRDPVVKTPDQPANPNTPVIPPPGTPGGRQDVEPK